MKLLALVLALSCVVATARKKGQYWPTSTKVFTSHRFRREVDSQDSIVANLKSTPRLPFDDNEHLVLFDNGPTTVDLDGDNNEIPGFQPQPKTSGNNIYRIDENDYLGAYTFHPGAYGGFAQTLGTGGGFRWRREAGRHVESRFRS